MRAAREGMALRRLHAGQLPAIAISICRVGACVPGDHAEAV
jgi:hypothetical protein